MNYANIYSSIGSLQKIPVENPGVCVIQFVKLEDVFSFPEPDPITGISPEDVTLKAGKVWHDLISPDAERLFTEQQQQSSAGHYYRVQVNGYIAGNDAATVLKVMAMPFHDYVVRVKDRDGLWRLIGSDDSGASFTNSYTSGDSESSRRRNYSFTWESLNPCIIVPGLDQNAAAGLLTEDGEFIHTEDDQIILN